MICFLEKERRIVPRNEGSGGSNEILVGDGSKVWDWSFKVALHGSVMFYELQIAYKLLTLFCWLIPILGEEGWDWANKVGAMWNFAGNLYFSQNTIEVTQYWLTSSSDWVLPDCVWMDAKCAGSGKTVTRSMRELCAQGRRGVGPSMDPEWVMGMPREWTS